MSELLVTQCRNCSGRVFWAMGPDGRAMPVDNAAHPEGPFVTLRRGGQVFAEVYDVLRHGKAIRRTSHFDTCALAGQARGQHP